jgi:tetratricopeptide (TPR) repeat protein
MAEDAELLSDEPGENTMLREAIEALRLGDRARARDLLTRLLKTDQKNPTYWLWLSATVDTQRERLYCLQTVLQLDPQNASAKRGLILFGALPPDPSVPPFPINRPRAWEEKLITPQEPKEKNPAWTNPVVRLFVMLGITVIVIGSLFMGRSLLFPNRPTPYLTPTHHPTMTITFTPTVTPAFRTPTPTFLGPTPLWMFLDSTYTPTPLYVMTQHPVVSRSAFEAGLRFLGAKDYENALALFEQAITLEPGAPDLYYYEGETYRDQGDSRRARDAYQVAINLDSTFAPAFLGRARANLDLDPKAEIIYDMNEAIILDPNFAEAYIARGEYLIETNPYKSKTDLVKALEITPDSALAYLYLADAQLNLREYDAALESATHANQLDITLVPVYLTLARAYIATGQTGQAVSVLLTYSIFRPDDASAFLQMGIAYNSVGEYEAAVQILNKAINANRRNAEAYFQRGTAYLNLDSPNLAETDFKSALNYDPFDFDSQLGLAHAYFMQGKPGDAYMQAETKALPLAHSDGTLAQVYYWEALFLEAIGESQSDIGARNTWYKLIALPADVMPEAWRIEAYQHLNITPTFTPTLSPTKTPTETPSMTPTMSPTKTPTETPTKTP